VGNGSIEGCVDLSHLCLITTAIWVGVESQPATSGAHIGEGRLAIKPKHCERVRHLRSQSFGERCAGCDAS
jgi:hypothetical protein